MEDMNNSTKDLRFRPISGKENLDGVSALDLFDALIHELSALHGRTSVIDGHLRANAVVLAVDLLRLSSAIDKAEQLERGREDLKSFSSLMNSRAVEGVVHSKYENGDTPQLHVFFDGGREAIVTHTNLETGLFNIRWVPGGFAAGANFSFNLDKEEALRRLSDSK
jgi:hypothetical protein